MKKDYFDEIYGPFIPIHILKEERTKREHADYIKRMEMLFTINPRPHNPTNYNTNVDSFSSFPNQESEPRQEEIDVVSKTNDVLPPSNDDSDDEVDGDLRVYNVVQNSKHEYSESEDSDLDNPLLPLPPPEPPDKEFDFETEGEISIERNLIVKFECINARMKFDVEDDVFEFIMFSILSTESEDTIFDPGSRLYTTDTASRGTNSAKDTADIAIRGTDSAKDTADTSAFDGKRETWIAAMCREIASWVLGTITWVFWGRGVGTVLVSAGVREWYREEDGLIVEMGRKFCC
nr:hypothetical protein [Tanacetum cinerariifolium]